MTEPQAIIVGAIIVGLCMPSVGGALRDVAKALDRIAEEMKATRTGRPW